MRSRAPFQPEDLAELDKSLLARAEAVVAVGDVFDGVTGPGVLDVRHDVDDRGWAAVLGGLPRWEQERGYRSTYFILHSAPYWQNEQALRRGLDEIVGCGHEVGIHANCLAQALRTGRDPDEILNEALARLRGWGHTVRGVVGHGDSICYRPDGTVQFANDEMFVGCARPTFGAPDRTLQYRENTLELRPRPLADFGLEYEALRLPRVLYFSDSGGYWTPLFSKMVSAFPPVRGPTQILWHPDWWDQALK